MIATITNDDLDDIINKIMQRFRELECYPPICQRCNERVNLAKKEAICICASCTYDIDYKKIKELIKLKDKKE